MKLDYTEMGNSAKKLDTEMGNFDDAIRNMQTIINSLPDIWEGETSEKYVEQFADLKPSFEKTRDLVGDIAEQMRDIVNAVKTADSDIAKKVGVKKS